MREVGDQRIHGATAEAPIERFARDEAAALRPLDGRPPFGQMGELARRVQADATVEPVSPIRFGLFFGEQNIGVRAGACFQGRRPAAEPAMGDKQPTQAEIGAIVAWIQPQHIEIMADCGFNVSKRVERRS